jgi:hypothetical protein
MGTDWDDGGGTAPRETTRYALVGQSAFEEIAPTTCDSAILKSYPEEYPEELS